MNEAFDFAGFFSVPRVHEDTVFFGGDQFFIAIDVKSGVQRWSFACGTAYTYALFNVSENGNRDETSSREILLNPGKLFIEGEVSMKISEQARTQRLRLIDEEENLDPLELEAFDRRMQATYEAFQPDSVQQQRFDEYCRSSCGLTSSMRLRCGVSMLKQALYKDAPQNYSPMGATA